MTSEPLPDPRAQQPAAPYCSACVKLLEQEQKALAVHDHSKAVDCRVLLTRHRSAKHGLRD